MRIHYYLFIVFGLLLTGCGAYYNQPTGVQKAVLGEGTPATSLLKDLPKPKEQVVVGVYKFRDQTGQYKPQENGSSFSTAVTQGATSILIKALEDSKWFIPIERENIGNLLQERNLIRATRQEYIKDANPNEPQLTPLLYAGVLLEGGIVSYDSNIITGGFGARYFGAGASVKYRQDRVTIYLRMISTSNGKILKSVYISKTILSQAIDESLFRYVNFKRLLEVETGYTTNEPVHMAVTEAIEKAVESLVLEGIKDNVWEADAPKWEVDNLLKAYAEETKTADVTGLYDRVLENRRSKFAIELSGGATLMDGDYRDPLLRPFGRGALKWMISPSFTVSASTNVVNLANKNLLDVGYITYDLNMEWIILPKDRLTPFLYGGGGYGMNRKFENTYGKFQYGAGLEYMASDQIGIKLFAEQNINFSDNVDYIVAGTRDDYYYKFGLGLTFYFGKKKK
ncbi:Curli production assembly/transport component CsgG [Flavobacterium sp. ACN2]|uniref:CsgG/HfaB family protein n=1 Tax=unclassified Flavobacterium TaxID=196869 RepID=UPI000BB31D95|nr:MULTISPECIES: CsgG/HfaB family protein [unclassified Flavobacterium]MDY0988779.1 CsgG/HfaB family protein [Flavobacterium sp. CFBP9031]PBI88461.1 Curli production assembly/transport component CsgG [Flavobacterium sp. ACN2]